MLDWLEVHELQEVVAGEVAGRQSDDDIVVFKSNGLAAWDVAIGAAALERARERGVGTSSRRVGSESRARRDGVLADCADDVGPVEQARALLRREPVAHVRVLEDLLELAPALVLADHVGGDALLLRRATKRNENGLRRTTARA